MKGKNLVIIDEDISTDQVWRKCNRYIIANVVNVLSGVTIKIEDGTSVSILNTLDGTNSLIFNSGSRVCGETVEFSSVCRNSEGKYYLSTNTYGNLGVSFNGSKPQDDYSGSDEKIIAKVKKLQDAPKCEGTSYRIKKIVIRYLGNDFEGDSLNFNNIVKGEANIGEIIIENNNSNEYSSITLIGFSNADMNLNRVIGVDYQNTLWNIYNSNIKINKELNFTGANVVGPFTLNKNCSLKLDIGSIGVFYVFPYQEWPSLNNSPYKLDTIVKEEVLVYTQQF